MVAAAIRRRRWFTTKESQTETVRYRHEPGEGMAVHDGISLAVNIFFCLGKPKSVKKFSAPSKSIATKIFLLGFASTRGKRKRQSHCCNPTLSLSLSLSLSLLKNQNNVTRGAIHGACARYARGKPVMICRPRATSLHSPADRRGSDSAWHCGFR
jgi:hypothetical protein